MIDDLRLMIWVGRLRRASRTGGLGICPDAPPFHYSIIPPFQSHAYCAKQTQLGWSGEGPEGEMCETNPIPATSGRSRAGTPNLRRADYAKQSQTWESWGIRERARWGSRVCETKPIHFGGTEDHCRVTDGTSCPNKANWPRRGVRGKFFMGKELW
jgi:hypothetical protein